MGLNLLLAQLQKGNLAILGCGEIMYESYLAHHGIKGQRWGVRRFQNPDGSLTPRGKRRFSKLIELDKEHEADVKNARAAADKEYRYMRSKGLGRGEDYKGDARELYITDEKFKKISDERYDAWKKSVESGERLIKEQMKVRNSNYNALTVMGDERTKQILKDYKDWEISEAHKRQNN